MMNRKDSGEWAFEKLVPLRPRELEEYLNDSRPEFIEQLEKLRRLELKLLKGDCARQSQEE